MGKQKEPNQPPARQPTAPVLKDCLPRGAGHREHPVIEPGTKPMPGRVVVSIAGYLLMVAALLALFILRALFSPSPIVIGVQAAAVALMIWARITFGMRSFHPGANTTEGALITSGPFRFIRHPIYAAVIYFALAGMLSRFSVFSLLAFAALVAGVFIRIHQEEHFLTKTYAEYAAYAKKTKRIVPYVF